MVHTPTADETPIFAEVLHDLGLDDMWIEEELRETLDAEEAKPEVAKPAVTKSPVTKSTVVRVAGKTIGGQKTTQPRVERESPS